MDTDWKQIKKKDKKLKQKTPSIEDNSKIINEENDVFIKNIKDRIINSNDKLMFIIRGPSGCGKSYLASKIKLNGIVLSTDDFFTDEHGTYKFDIRFLNEAHNKNKEKAKNALKDGKTPIIIDNTNIKIWEFEPYVKLAVDFNYTVELLEPSTSWKRNAFELEKRNRHKVPLSKIKTQISEFEKCDLAKLVQKFKQSTKNTSQKPSSMKLFESSMKSEWFIPDLDDDISSNTKKPLLTIVTQQVTFTKNKLINEDKSTQTEECVYFSDYLKEIDTQARNINLWYVQSNDTCVKSSILKYDKSCSTEEFSEYLFQDELNEKLNIIKSLFPDYKHDILENLLLEHDYDVNSVAIVLSESTPDDFELPKPIYNPLSLRCLCENVLNSMDDALKQHFELLDVKSQSEDSEDSISSGIADMDRLIDQRDSDFDSEDGASKEPILSFKLDKEFACSLFNLFNQNDEKFNDIDNFNVDIDYKLASELYECWMRAKKKPNPQLLPKPPSSIISESTDDLNFEEEYKRISRQIEQDAQLALELFEQENIIDPISGKPVYLSDNGENTATISLRQIMAEQRAESLSSGIKSFKKAKSPTRELQLSTRNDPNLAVCIKRRKIYELYEHKIDRVILDKIFYENNYNYNDTCKWIEQNYGLSEEKMRLKNEQISRQAPKSKSPPPRIIKTLPQVAPNPTPNSNGQEYRQMAHRYFEIRQEYFEKASEAFARGWGAVAQYYAECGHKQSIYMKKFNNKASINIFALNNANLDSLNTLDLHGLSCNEALSMFKKVFQKKKADLKYDPRQKSFLYVITGCGRHSFNNKSKLRPTIINYLNRTGISFKEPNLGLLKVDLV